MVNLRFPDLLAWLNRWFPHLYFSTRIGSLILFMVLAVLWGLGGWDTTFQYLIYRDAATKGIGIHISTIMIVVVLFYLSQINLQGGGILDFKEIKRQIRSDLIKIQLHFWGTPDHPGRMGHREIRERSTAGYPGLVDPARATLFSVGLVFGMVFMFELPYVFLHDWLNWGVSPWWPIYAFKGDIISMTTRNFSYSLTVVGGPILLWFAAKKHLGELVHRYRFSFRFDRKWGVLVLGMVGVWALWVMYPLDYPKVEYEAYPVDRSVDLYLDGEFLKTDTFNVSLNGMAFPQQEEFPQTVYTYYVVSPGEPYSRDEMGEFYVPDVGIHGVNLAAKVLTFAVIAYPMMVRVEET